MKLSDAADLEPVIEVFLQRHVPLSEYNMHASKGVQGESGVVCLSRTCHI